MGERRKIGRTDFNSTEFDGFKKQAGLNSFTLTPKQWIEKTSVIGLISKAGCYCFEILNAHFISDGLSREARLERLNRIAILRMRVLADDGGSKKLDGE